MKKTVITLVLSVLFMVFSGFVDTNTVEVEMNKDSTNNTVFVEFSDPHILIDDYRDLQAITELFDKYSEGDSALIGILGGINYNLGQFIESQERRYESSMDCLQQKTGMSIDSIQEAHAQRQRIIATEIVISLIALVLIMILVFNRGNRKKGWQNQLAWFVMLIVAYSLAIMLVDRLLFLNTDYHFIKNIIELST